MKAEINALGYDLVIDKETSVEEIEKREYVLLKRKTALSWLFSIAVMCVSMRWDRAWVHVYNQPGCVIDSLGKYALLRSPVLCIFV